MIAVGWGSLASGGQSCRYPPKANRKIQRDYDKDLYKARHLIENFFAKLKLFRAIATRYARPHETSPPLSTSLLPPSGLFDDTP
jgi:transposase